MQGDLISKSELLESLNDWIDENTDIKTILRWIEEFEIAYDVEKVVAEIEQIYGTNIVGIYGRITEYPYIPKDRVLQVVRNGGKE